MQFSVEFRTYFSGPQNWSVVDDFNPGIGLDVIEAVREDLNMPQLSSKMIHMEDSCNSKPTYLKVDVTDCANVYKIPPFAGRANVIVIVPTGWLGQFYSLNITKYYQIYNDGWFDVFAHTFNFFTFRIWSKAKKLSHVYGKYELDDDKIIEAWMADGCPLYWGIAEKEYNHRINEFNKAVNEKAAKAKLTKEAEEKKREEELKRKKREKLKYLEADLASLTKRFSDILKESNV